MRDSKNKLSYQYDPYNIIQLSVNNRNNNIYDCFNEFCSIEKLNSSSYRQVKFYSFPKILVLQFKRNIFSVKNNKLITFPHLLDMNNQKYDSIKFNQTVYTYIPYGPYKEMIPYLSRRLYENLDTIKYMVK